MEDGTIKKVEKLQKENHESRVKVIRKDGVNQREKTVRNRSRE